MKALILLSLIVLIHGADHQKVKMTGANGSVFESVVSNEEVVVEEELEDKDILTVNKKISRNDMILEGDMMMSFPQERNVISDTSLYWDRVIPIQYDPSLNLLAISAIEDSRQEYEMRTCLSFVDRTNEPDYLYFLPLDGCWSYFGKRQIGRQNVSIGIGCEDKATVIHEIMHALAIYHEQSRADRDDYVAIELGNVEIDQVHNFNKYNYDTTDNRRVPYDYDSVMHYGEATFSHNDQKTILTRDPQLQHKIGQLRTFSEGDVTKINRMYDCADTLRVSYTCNFDEDLICGYVQDEVPDTVDWLRYEIGQTDGSHISSNLPQTDGTQGVEGTGSYMVFDTSEQIAGQDAYLASMRLKSNNNQQCMEFNYYMDLEPGSTGTLNVYIAEISTEDGDILSMTLVATFAQDFGAQWITDRRTVQASSVYKLVVEGISGGMPNDVIAIDDISILDRPCDSAYFKIADFSSLVASTQKGDSMDGPLLYTEEGYAFKILIFPNGHSNATDGYMSLFFALAQGQNDDNLQWPFHDQVVRMMVVDQGADALTRMNEHKSYLTSSSNGGTAWERPTSSVNPSWGYTNFMKLEHIMNTRNFLKHDSVVVSVNVKNMATYRQNHASVFAEPQSAKSSRDPLHASDDDSNHDLSININVEEQEKTMSSAAVIGVSFACAFAVLFLVSLVIVCVKQSHKQGMTTKTIANHSSRTKTEEGQFTNVGFQQEKI